MICYAAALNLKNDGNKSASNIVKEVALKSPSRADYFLEKINTPNKPQVVTLTPDEALSFMLTAQLTKHQYIETRKIARAHSANLYPPYSSILAAKLLTYPKNIRITEDECVVDLQSLLHHTVNRILLSTEIKQGHYTLIGKWGFDGSSGYTDYQQQWHDNKNEGEFNASVFVTSFVPLNLQTKNTGVSIWKNPVPSSTLYCRPIRILFGKETPEEILREESRVLSEVEKLQPFILNDIVIEFSLHLTMIDGKVCNTLSNSSSGKCYLCKATAKEMNDLERVTQKNIDEKYLHFGISPLHAYIRFFEHLLHISYRLDVQIWRVDSKTKPVVEERKKQVIQNFKNKMNLNVEQVRVGYGSSNTGNTARKFFSHPKLSSEVTGLNENVINQLGNILKALSSGMEINSTVFDEYCRNTAKLYVQYYNWYPMSPTVHKVLLHGSLIIKTAILPIGQLSEEAAESRNKDVRNYRELFTRKTSRVNTNTDLFQRLLSTSDPYISFLRKTPKSKKKKFNNEVRSLLIMKNYSLPSVSDISDISFMSISDEGSNKSDADTESYESDSE